MYFWRACEAAKFRGVANLDNFTADVQTGARFKFGANWIRFLEVLSDERISAAEKSLTEMMEGENFQGIRFLDAGSGSGLSSLVARRLGAKVTSFDFDPQSVACTEELKRRYFADDPEWIIERASILEGDSFTHLGSFDVVYSWGVLHHTGAMWLGLENMISAVAPGGRLFVAIYNDQGWKSHCWWLIKFIYNKTPRILQPVYAYTLGAVVTTLNLIKYTIKLRPMMAIAPLIGYQRSRGMSVTHDLIDWIGGFPYEFATFEVIQNYMEARGFQLQKGKRAQSLGCHEMIFRSIEEVGGTSCKPVSAATTNVIVTKE